MSNEERRVWGVECGRDRSYQSLITDRCPSASSQRWATLRLFTLPFQFYDDLGVWEVRIASAQLLYACQSRVDAIALNSQEIRLAIVLINFRP